VPAITGSKVQIETRRRCSKSEPPGIEPE
jgi:hypothetical protein